MTVQNAKKTSESAISRGFQSVLAARLDAGRTSQNPRFRGVQIAAALMLSVLIGCESDGPSQRERDRIRAEGQSIFASDPDSDSDPGLSPAPWSHWVIALGVYAPEERARAQENLSWIQGVGGLAEARLERRDTGLVIAYGVYTGASDPRAQADLTRLRQTEIEGKRPFAGAVLAPPISVEATGGNPAWDLTRVRAARGPDALYTLQIGIYGRGDSSEPSAAELKDFRAKAEEAVRDLRARGQDAFYYHGAARSTVTVGVFGPTDYDPLNMPGFRSPPLQQVQTEFPYNLLNGQAIRERVPGTEETRLQASSLVRIPESR